MTSNQDRVDFVELSDGSLEDVTQEELETVDQWADQFKEQLKTRPRCPIITGLE